MRGGGAATASLQAHDIHFNALDFLAGRAPGQSDPNLTKLFGFDTFRQSLL